MAYHVHLKPMKMKYNKEQLLNQRLTLTRDDFVLFWGHEDRGKGLTKVCLSQWYQCPFVVEGHCGCFYCKSIYSASEVKEWCDNDGRGDKTALCPKCGIDSVLGDATFVELTPELLELMNILFFGDGIDNVNVTVNGNS